METTTKVATVSQELKFPIHGNEEKLSWGEEKPKLAQALKLGIKQQASDSAEKKRARTRFTIYQKAELEAAFMSAPYLAPQNRVLLASRLRVTPTAIQSWFKNRRFKWRKEMKGSQPMTSDLPYIPFPYEPRFGCNTGLVPTSPQCQACCRGRRYPCTSFAVFEYPPH